MSKKRKGREIPDFYKIYDSTYEPGRERTTQIMPSAGDLEPPSKIRRVGEASHPALAPAAFAPFPSLGSSQDINLGDSGTVLPSDTEASLEFIRRHYIKLPQNLEWPHVILRSQLYYSIPDHTQVDRELSDLVKKGTIRQFKVSSRVDEYSYMFTDDYLKQLELSRKFLISQKKDHVIIERFVSNVIPVHNDVSIAKDRLRHLIGADVFKDLPLLVQSGILIIRNVDSYWFTIPDGGRIFALCENARKEILAILKRHPFREMLESELLKKPLKSSKLGMQFHVRDLVGARLLDKNPTPAGLLISIPISQLDQT